jgi:chromosome segregation ATPase
MQSLNKERENLEKEMKKQPVLTFADIIRALKEHPEWLEELRKIILTTELIELPKKFEEMLVRMEKFEKKVDKIERDVEILKQDVTVLKQDVAVLKQDVAVLKQDVAVLKQDVEILKQDVAVLKQDVAILKLDVAVLKQDVGLLKQDVSYLKGEFGRFKGKEFERTIRERYYAYFGRILRKSKLILFEEIIPFLETAEEEKIITEDQKVSALQLDLLIKGEIKTVKKEVYLAIEVSYSLQEDDIERAVERAGILAYVLKGEVIPTIVAVEIKDEIQKSAEDKGAFVIKADF